MKVWKIGERITIPEKDGEREKHGSIVGVSPRMIIVQLDDEFREEGGPPIEVEVSIDEFGVPNFGDDMSDVQRLLDKLGTAAEARGTKEKTSICICPVCRLRIQIAAGITTTMIEKMATAETHPDPEAVVRIAYSYTDHLIYHHAENPAADHEN